jgi:hypothetical protein
VNVNGVSYAARILQFLFGRLVKASAFGAALDQQGLLGNIYSSTI